MTDLTLEQYEKIVAYNIDVFSNFLKQKRTFSPVDKGDGEVFFSNENLVYLYMNKKFKEKLAEIKKKKLKLFFDSSNFDFGGVLAQMFNLFTQTHYSGCKYNGSFPRPDVGWWDEIVASKYFEKTKFIPTLYEKKIKIDEESKIDLFNALYKNIPDFRDIMDYDQEKYIKIFTNKENFNYATGKGEKHNCNCKRCVCLLAIYELNNMLAYLEKNYEFFDW